MKNFQRFAELVQSGQVALYYELSLPRSTSTAWQIAMVEAPEIHGQINEASFHPGMKLRAFNDTDNSGPLRSLEEYFGRLLERLEGNSQKKKIGLLNSSMQRPVGLVINDLAHSVSSEDLMHILKLTNKIAITIRDPRIQGLSALTRIINDTLDGPGGGNISPKMAMYLANKTEFTAEEIDHLIGPDKDKINPEWIRISKKLSSDTIITSSLLLELIKEAVLKCTEGYLTLCWENLNQQLAMIRAVRHDAQLIIIDGTDILKDPLSIMKQSAEAFGITFSPDMINNWHKANKEKFYCCITEGWGELAITNHWNGPVRNSSQFEAKPNSITEPHPILNFPPAMQPALEKCLGFYAAFNNCKEKINLPNSGIEMKSTTIPFNIIAPVIFSVPITVSGVVEDSNTKKSAVTSLAVARTALCAEDTPPERLECGVKSNHHPSSRGSGDT